MRKKGIWLLISSALCLLLAFSLAVPVLAQEGPPPPPHCFYGTVTINGELATAPTEISAAGTGVLTDVDYNPLTTTVDGEYGSHPVGPWLVVQGYIDEGTPIEFYVNEARAQCYDVEAQVWSDTYPFHSQTFTELNLEVGEAPVDVTPPTVVSNTPEADATNVAIDVVVSATFDEDVTAVDLSGITIDELSGVSASLDEATDTITIAHDDFALLTSYTVTIPAGAVQDVATVPNANALHTWSFTTEAVVDIIAPTVVSTTPEADVTSVAIDAVVSATFSEDIQEDANFGGITISGATAVSATIDGATLTIAHDAFAYETSYTVTIPAGAVKDLAGNSLAEAKVWSFTVVTEEEAEFDPYIYDTDGDGEFSKAETLAAVNDYLAGNITKDDALEVVKLYFS